MILADAHVHIYDCFDLSIFLNAAVDNFNAEIVRRRHHDTFSAVLFLTETRNENKFHDVLDYTDGRNRNGSQIAPHWRFHSTEESYSIHARRDDGHSLFLIAGCQIVTSENLEVLALSTDRRIRDGSSLEETVRHVLEIDGIPIVPWGVGKWFGRRGKIVKRFLESFQENKFFMGDNGGRPVFWPQPSLFKLSLRKGIRIVPGSDPLPFAPECLKPGSFGFVLKKNMNHKYPARDIKKLLLNKSTEIYAYGKHENSYRFLRNQIAMQILKRKTGNV